MKFYYTYILHSQNSPDRFYIGFTEHLESRLKSHNRGENPHTYKYKPWRIKRLIAWNPPMLNVKQGGIRLRHSAAEQSGFAVYL